MERFYDRANELKTLAQIDRAGVWGYLTAK